MTMFLHNTKCFSCDQENFFFEECVNSDRIRDYVAAQKDLYEILYFRTFDKDRNRLETSTQQFCKKCNGIAEFFAYGGDYCAHCTVEENIKKLPEEQVNIETSEG